MGLLKCVGYIALIGVGSFLLGRVLPPALFKGNRFPYRAFPCEKSGAIYEVLKIRKWKTRVPDMSRIFPQIMQEKKIGKNYQKDLPLMIQETCIAEFIHVLLCFAGLRCIWLWPGMGGITVTVIYVLSNIPFILIQRYNRPRLMRLQENVLKKIEGD